MKKEFIGFYDPTDEEIEQAWNDGIFAFDANTLLNLYRYTDVTRKDFTHALKSIKERLFIPSQVAYEYLNNRVGVIDGLEKSYFELEKVLKDNFDNNLKKSINAFKRHPSIVIETILGKYEDFLKKISVELEKQKKRHPDFKTKDNILNELTELFESCIGKEPSKTEVVKIYAEGKERYAEEIPPGYKDLKEKEKKGSRHLYGDLLVWKELIEFSKKNKKPLVFVTDDRKEDWWKIENGKTIRPREELIKEFYDITGIRILIYNADQFLKFAKERGMIPTIKDETIEEVKEIRIYDEARNTNYYDMREFYRNWHNVGDNSREVLNRLSNIDNINKIMSNPFYDSAQTYKNVFNNFSNDSLWRIMNPVSKIKDKNDDLLNDDNESK
ncbi:PIN domain-containing protein [Flavobacterium dankookense]|uniref:PIN like domain-containing protein n=1 Tax=Flavobacterium dankookense TaxID=706186 RepID=A0A4R6QFE0_9FLAO|nr:PIN domain-containing protein [Flavobacterium dankookense]TDP60663.1 hypothetical protein BC748_0258 [Flavobacterium dankookense]